MKDFYAILEVLPTASQETIREQYYLLIQAWHPDKFSNPAQKGKAEDKSKEINAAYDVLKNLQKRSQYDGQLSRFREEQSRRQTEEQRQRKQAEEKQHQANYERQQRERVEEERLRIDRERQKQERAEKEKLRIKNEQAQRKQSNQSQTEVNRNFQNPIRVLIVDDIEITRANIRKLVSNDFDIRVVGEASNGAEAIEQFDKLMPDIVTMDINMPVLDGLSATAEIRKRHPNANVIILSIQTDPKYKQIASLLGAKEYIEIPPLQTELLDAIRRVVDRGAL